MDKASGDGGEGRSSVKEDKNVGNGSGNLITSTDWRGQCIGTRHLPRLIPFSLFYVTCVNGEANVLAPFVPVVFQRPVYFRSFCVGRPGSFRMWGKLGSTFHVNVKPQGRGCRVEA